MANSVNDTDIDRSIFVTMPNSLGDDHITLLSMLGYKSLRLLAEATRYDIQWLPGFGPKRMQLIEATLKNHGLNFANREHFDLSSDIIKMLFALRGGLQVVSPQETDSHLPQAEVQLSYSSNSSKPCRT